MLLLSSFTQAIRAGVTRTHFAQAETGATSPLLSIPRSHLSLAAPTHQVVAVTEHRLETRPHLLQHGISCVMPPTVVDLLEVVDVDHEEDQVGTV